ncbi:hypothetical protein PVAP13_9NG514014 [Panicum virgatum]|uniref:Uncharacterized protein n=1 Tax=Panicum virgatum TaxID=38727 RepID=A0A8T0MTM9_PANVG|nr:hypothetical protein PVAP13_9NG514014 [Panicum virgatum]
MRRATCPRARAAGATRAAWCSCAGLHPVDPTGNRQQLPLRSLFGSLMVELADGGNWADGTPPWWMRKTGIPIRRLSLMNWSLQVDRMTLLSKLDLSISPRSATSRLERHAPTTTTLLRQLHLCFSLLFEFVN